MISKKMFVAFCALFVLLSIGPALATISISEPVISMTVDAGQNLSKDTVVSIGSSDNPTDFMADVFGLGQGPDGSPQELKADKDVSPYSARSFLNVSPRSFHLDPGKSQKITIKGNIPTDVGEGGRYAVINIHTKPQNASKGVNIIAAMDVAVLLTISGTLPTISGEITDMKFYEPYNPMSKSIVSKNLIKPVSAKQQNISVIFKNTGNYYYKARASAELFDANGSRLSKNSTELSVFSIIPTYSKEFRLQLVPSQELKPGSYRISATISLEDGTALASKELNFDIKP